MEYASVLRPFADRNSRLYLPDFWQRLKADLSLDPQAVAEIDNHLAQARAGSDVGLTFNNTPMSAEAIYHLVAEGELFDESPGASKTLSDFTIGPSRQLFRFIAHSYMTDLAAVLSRVFAVLQPVFSSQAALTLPSPRCIYCLSTTNSFTSEDHVLAESIAGETIVLPQGAVCDQCNHGVLAKLDAFLASFPPVAALRVFLLPHTKQGRYPLARFPNFRLEKTTPRSIRIRVFGKDPVVNKPEGGFTLTWEGRTPDLHQLARAVMRVGIGVLAHDYGYDRVCHADFDSARGFIQGGSAYRGRLLLKTDIQPEPSISLFVNDDAERAVFAASLFGVEIGINLRESDEALPEPLPESLHVVELGGPS